MKRCCLCLGLLLALPYGFSPEEAFAGNAVRACIPVIEPASSDLTFHWISLSPSPDNNQLLGLTLEDIKDTESSAFKLVVLDSAGNILSQAWDVAVSAAYWLDSENILYFGHDSIEMKFGKGILWNLATDQKTRLLPWLEGGYQATCWDAETKRLLFTVATPGGACVLYETTPPAAAGQISIQTAAELPFAPYRVFSFGNTNIWIEHPETHSLYMIQ
jgi:hypothetical protein